MHSDVYRISNRSRFERLFGLPTFQDPELLFLTHSNFICINGTENADDITLGCKMSLTDFFDFVAVLFSLPYLLYSPVGSGPPLPNSELH